MDTPLAKLLTNIGRHAPIDLQSRRIVVLLSTGSLCPVHLGHIAMLELSKKYVEESPSKPIVLAGFLSPSHDHHTSWKLGDLNASPEHRIQMCRLATQDSDWIDVDSWEATQSHFVDFSAVVGRLYRHLNGNEAVKHALLDQIYNDPLRSTIVPEIFVLYVCGFDHAMKCSLRGLACGGVAVVMRGDRKREEDTRDLEARLQKMFLERWRSTSFIVPGHLDTLNASSTKVRALLSEGKDITSMCGKRVAEYVMQNNLWGSSKSTPP